MLITFRVVYRGMRSLFSALQTELLLYYLPMQGGEIFPCGLELILHRTYASCQCEGYYGDRVRDGGRTDIVSGNSV